MFKEMFTNNLSSIIDSQSRVEMRNDLLVHSYSSFFDGFFEGVGEFSCVCLTNAVEIQQRTKIVQTSDVYHPIKVRPINIHGFVIPDPCTVKDPSGMLQRRLVQAHPIAFSTRPAGHGERAPVFGDILVCKMAKSPKDSGKIRSIRYEYPLSKFIDLYDCSNKFINKGISPLSLLSFTSTVPFKYVSINTSKNRFNKYYSAAAKKIKSNYYRSKKWTNYYERFDRLFIKFGRLHGVDPALVKAVAYSESRMNPNAYSKKGALGLMQFILSTGIAYGMKVTSTEAARKDRKYGKKVSASVDQRKDPVKSINGGARYLSRLHNYNHVKALSEPERTVLQIASYNAGPGATKKHGIKIIEKYKETRAYVPSVLAAKEFFETQPNFQKLMNE